MWSYSARSHLPFQGSQDVSSVVANQDRSSEVGKGKTALDLVFPLEFQAFWSKSKISSCIQSLVSILCCTLPFLRFRCKNAHFKDLVI